jgi:hypothetical protein
VAIALDVMIFASTVLEAVYGIVRGFVEIKDNLTVLLTFRGGLTGVQAAVDGIFELLDRLGLKRRAQQFMGSIIELFDRFIRWGAPVIGSVIGTAIPYDASATGRVIEFFLYPIKFFITRGWLLLIRAWNMLRSEWQEMIADRDKWNGLLLSLVDLIKRLFPGNTDASWKSRLIDKARDIGLGSARLNPLVVVGVVKRDKLDEAVIKAAEMSKKVSGYVDTVVSRWIDTLVIPNIERITATVQAAMGLGFGFIYMLYAYTPDGTRKKLGIATVAISLDVSALSAHLARSPDARSAFIADTDRRLHEIRAAMCATPSDAAMQFIAVCAQVGVPLDVSAPHFACPALASRNFELHRRAIFPHIP